MPPAGIFRNRRNEVLTAIGSTALTVQAGTPMTVTGEDSLPRWIGAGRLPSHFSILLFENIPGSGAEPRCCRYPKARS